MHAAARLLAVGAILATLLGCGRPTGTLAGKLTFEGRPAERAMITIKSTADPGVQCRGTGLADGTYQVDYGVWNGLPVGPATFEIVHETQLDGSPLPGGEEGLRLRTEGQTKRHAATFTKEIVAGPNTIDFEITEGT